MLAEGRLLHTGNATSIPVQTTGRTGTLGTDVWARAGDGVRAEDAASGEAGVGALPNVIVIGAMKCGSTSLHKYLDAHPQIAMSEGKELNFFYRDERWENQGVPWYRSQFDADAPVRGESSVNYTKSPEISRVTAERMRQLVPDAKLIYLVRHPIDRAISHYLHTKAAGNEERPLSEALRDFDEAYVARGLYFANVRPFLKAFSHDQLLVIPQEALLAERSETLDLVFSFLGVDSVVDAPEFSVMWQTAASKLGSTAEGETESPTTIASTELDPGLRKSLTEYFRPDFKHVRRLIAPRFRTGWRLVGNPGYGTASGTIADRKRAPRRE